jgi:hypothetical protein
VFRLIKSLAESFGDSHSIESQGVSGIPPKKQKFEPIARLARGVVKAPTMPRKCMPIDRALIFDMSQTVIVHSAF